MAVSKLEETTTKEKEIIENAISKAKSNAINDIQYNYDSILLDWDKTKAELDLEKQLALATF